MPAEFKIAIVGSNGRLGAALAREYHKNYEVIGYSRTELDVENLARVREILHATNFGVLINCAAYTNVDLCESQRARAFLINAEMPRELAEICRAKRAKLIHFSTDYVFDGEKREPYHEEDPANPISVYGESKRTGEKNVVAVLDRHLVVRLSWVFGPDRPSFIDKIIQRARAEEQVDAVADKLSGPTYSHDVAQMLPRFFDLDVAGGILHFAGAGECSWQEYAQHALDCCHEFGISLKATKVAPLSLRDMKNWVARRPVYSVLSTAKYTGLTGVAPRPWREAVADYIKNSYSKK
jgi:dTDP-4-dehydrorhamnose reductase